MEKCQAILNKLNIIDIPKEDTTIKEMQEQIKQLRQMLEMQRKPTPSQPTVQQNNPQIQTANQ